MDNAIVQRIRRIYKSIGNVEEYDLNKLKAKAIQNEKIKAIFQDFRGGLTDDDLFNYALMIIYNISNLEDNLRRWAANNGHDKTKVDQTVNNSIDLKIIKDLANNDRHGYPPRNRGFSGTCPQLVNINRVMQLKTQANKGSIIGMTLGADGIPKIIGDGTAMAIITGDVVNEHNNRIGDLYEIANRAVEAWEHLLTDYGFNVVNK